MQAALLALRAGPALIFLILVLVISAITPVFYTWRNIGNNMQQVSLISVLAIGQLLVIITRGIDLSVGSTVALASVCGYLMYGHTHNGALITAAIVLTGVAVGLANGLIYVFGRVPHPFIVTLASLTIVRGMAYHLANGTTHTGMPHIVTAIGGGSFATHVPGLGGAFPWLPWSFVLVLGFAGFILVLMTKMVWGRWLYAVGGNPDAARRTGVPVKWVLVSVYVISGLAGGLGGIMISGVTDAGSGNFAIGSELDAIAAVIIGGAAFAGGRGHIGNALIGAFIIQAIRNALLLHGQDEFTIMIVQGVVILLAVEADVLRGYIEERFRVAQAARAAVT